MATFWERAVNSDYRMFSLYFDIVNLAIFHFGFEGGTLVLIAFVPGHCLSFTLHYKLFSQSLFPTAVYTYVFKVERVAILTTSYGQRSFITKTCHVIYCNFSLL